MELKNIFCEEKHAEKKKVLFGGLLTSTSRKEKYGKLVFIWWRFAFTLQISKGEKNDVPLPEMSKLAGRSGRSRFARNWFGHASTAAGRHRL